MKNMHIAFSPPDITEEEIAEVTDTLRSGWITTGPKTKLFEKQIAEYCHTCLLYTSVDVPEGITLQETPVIKIILEEKES